MPTDIASNWSGASARARTSSSPSAPRGSRRTRTTTGRCSRDEPSRSDATGQSSRCTTAASSASTTIRVSAPASRRSASTKRLSENVWVVGSGSQALAALEEAEDRLVRGDEDRAEEPQLATSSSQLAGGLLGAPGQGCELFFVHSRPVALDEIAPVLCRSGHANDATSASSKRNRVFPYVCAGSRPDSS